MNPITHKPTEEAAFKAPVAAPPFWPTTHMGEFAVAQAIRELIEPDGNIDITVAESVMFYGMQLQSMSGSGAELMARMRMALEEARGKAIVECMCDESLKFDRMSATLQNKMVDSRIAVYHAAYTYAEYLNKRVSYALDYVRSLLSYIKEDMRNSQPIPQR